MSGVVNYLDGNRTQNFSYDSLNRITNAYTNGPNWGETYTIDPWGNLTNRGPYPGKTNYEGLGTSALTSNRLTGYQYDIAGNLTNNGGVIYSYDGENRIKATAGWTYLYDGDGNRVEKTNGTTGTLYWRDPDGEVLSESDLAGNMQADYIFFHGQRIARVDLPSLTVHYYFSDHLGSTSTITDATGNITEQSDYYPYGGEIPVSGSDPNHFKFNGKERDRESGLDYFGARHYASQLGRFMVPDWADKPTAVPYANFGNPQSLNLYSYVENNPTTTGDPDGHVDWEYVKGAVQAYLSDTVAGGYLHGDTNTNPSFHEGQRAGDALAFAQGVTEVSAGEGGTGAGVALMLTANPAGEGAGAVVITGSQLLEAHGALTAAAASVHLMAMEPKAGSSGRPGAGKRIDDKVKKEALEENKAANEGEARCVFCKEKVGPGTENKINYDHQDARANGGNNTLANVNVACEYCNKSKGTGKEPKNPKHQKNRDQVQQ